MSHWYEICTHARSSNHVDESTSAPLLRLPLMLGEDTRAFRSERKMETSSWRISTVQFLQRIIWNWWRTDLVWVEYFPGHTSLEILQKIPKDLKDQNIEPEKFEDWIIFMSMFNNIAWTKRGNLERCVSNSENQELRGEILATKQDIPRPGRRKEVVRNSQLHAWRRMGFHRHTNGRTIQRYKSSSIQEYSCFESWKSEKQRWQKYHTLQCGFIGHRTLVSHNSLSNSAQYLRSSFKLVWRVRSTDSESRRVDLPQFAAKENEQLLKNVKPQEVKSLAQTPRSDKSNAVKSRWTWLEAYTRDIDKTTLQQPQKGLAVCLDATLDIKAHRWVPARTPTVHRCPQEKRGWPTTRSTVRQTCTTKRQEPLSSTTYMVAEPCSVQSAQPGSSDQNKLPNADKKLTDSLWAVASNRDREHRKHDRPEDHIQERRVDRQSPEWARTSRGRRTVPGSGPVQHTTNTVRGGKARHHPRARRSQSTDRMCNVGW